MNAQPVRRSPTAVREMQTRVEEGLDVGWSPAEGLDGEELRQMRQQLVDARTPRGSDTRGAQAPRR